MCLVDLTMTTNGEHIGTNGVNGHLGATNIEGKIIGQKDLAFLRKLVDIVIKDGLIGAMDRNT